MIAELANYFSEADFMPHGHCYLWKPGLVWTHVSTDVLIGLAYVSISLSLYALIKKIKIPFSAMVLSFGVFIGACGATHFMEVWNLWNYNYWLAGLVKVLTAIASVATGIWLVKLKPQIILVAEAARLSEERKELLEKANASLAFTNRTLEEQQKILTHSAKMSALGEMAGGIAHEVNSPLGIITVHANQLERLVKRGTLSSEKIVEEAQLIAATAKRIGEIIKGLRAFAREGEKDPFELTSVASILGDALILCQNRFKAFGVDIRMNTVDPGLALECRSVQIGQVILNLLNNAFDAVETLTEKWVEIRVEERGAELEVSILDSGRGISPAILPNLMLPFFTTKEVGRGTGLGLSISKGIVEAHRGSLVVDTDCPHTRFVMTLPKIYQFTESSA